MIANICNMIEIFYRVASCTKSCNACNIMCSRTAASFLPSARQERRVRRVWRNIKRANAARRANLMRRYNKVIRRCRHGHFSENLGGINQNKTTRIGHNINRSIDILQHASFTIGRDKRNKWAAIRLVPFRDTGF